MTIDELGALFLKHRKKIVRTIGKEFPTVDYDTIDQCYADLWFNIQNIKQIRLSHFKYYLQTALRNELLTHLRDLQSSKDIFERSIVMSLSDTDVQEAVDVYSHKTGTAIQPECEDPNTESTKRYKAVMSGVPETLRYVFELHYIDGCTQNEIAVHLNTYPQHVWRMLQRAKEIVKQRYKYVLEAWVKGDLR